MAPKNHTVPTEGQDEKMVTIIVDREITDGGIRINFHRYVGEVTVPESIAKELLRIQEEYGETKKKLANKNAFVRTKSDLVKFRKFAADPEHHQHLIGNPQFQKYGLLDPRDWEFLSEGAKEYFKKERLALYGY